MKKRLCLFMMSLLLFMSVGCSQVTPQTPAAPVTEASENESGSITVIDSNNGNKSIITDSSDDNSNTTREDFLSDGLDADFQDNNSNNVKEDTLSGSTAASSDADNTSIEESGSYDLPEDGSYTSKEDVALYIHLYGHLPPNFITKKEAEALGWKGGSLEPYAPGMCIGGSFFGNYEELLPIKDGRSYTECDIDTLGADKRGAKRIVFSNDGLIYYTEDHYASFELLYGEADP